MPEFMPTTASVKKAFSIITSEESAQYLTEKFVEKLEKLDMVDKAQAMIGEVKRFEEHVAAQTNESWSPWQGTRTAPPTKFQSFHDNLAALAAKTIGQQHLLFEYAVSDKAECLRAYSSDGEPCDDSTSHALDQLFNSWLSEYGLVTQKGTIYQGNANGDITLDASGNKQPADVAHVKAMLQAGEFEKFVQKKNKDISINMKEHAYPEQAMSKEPDAGNAASASQQQGPV